MLKKLIPTYKASSVFSINYDYFINKGYEMVFFDLDNTLANPYVYKPDSEVKKLFKALKEKGLKIYILSNNHEKRVKDFTKELGVGYLYEVKKPNKKKLAKFISENKIDISKVIYIGDQIMTDVLLANFLNIKSILVNPLTKQDEPITFIPRLLDKYYRNKISKKHLSKDI